MKTEPSLKAMRMIDLTVSTASTKKTKNESVHLSLVNVDSRSNNSQGRQNVFESGGAKVVKIFLPSRV